MSDPIEETTVSSDVAQMREDITQSKYMTYRSDLDDNVYYTVGLSRYLGFELLISFCHDYRSCYQLLNQLADRALYWSEIKRHIKEGRVEGFFETTDGMQLDYRPVYFQSVDRDLFDCLADGRHSEAMPGSKEFKVYQVILQSFNNQLFPWEGGPFIPWEPEQQLVTTPPHVMH
jgi:hypothetical protein